MTTASAPALVHAARGLTTGRRDVLTLAFRPTSPVVHLYSGPLTPSGRYAAAGGRTVCQAHTRRLSVFEQGLGLLDHGRRVCGRCVARLSSLSGRATQPVSRDQWLGMYRGTTLGDLVLMLAITPTAEATHRVGFLADLLFGHAPLRRPADPVRAARFDLDRAVITTRRRLRAAERTPEEIAALEARREADAYNDQLVAAAQRKTARLDKLTDRANRGRYLTRDEREAIGMTG